MLGPFLSSLPGPAVARDGHRYPAMRANRGGDNPELFPHPLEASYVRRHHAPQDHRILRCHGRRTILSCVTIYLRMHYPYFRGLLAVARFLSDGNESGEMVHFH